MKNYRRTPIPHLRELGSRVERRRLALRWTQRQLGRETGIDSSRLSRLERGMVSPTLTEIRRLCTALGTSSDELLFGDRPTAGDDAARFLRRAVHLLELGLAAEAGAASPGEQRS